MNQLLEIIKVSRPGFYPTHVWFYTLPFARQDMFGSIPFWIGACYVCFPMGLLLYGWNDLSDVETDANNPRKGTWLFGGRPDELTRRRLPWIIAAVQIPFVFAFIWFAGPKMLGWFAAMLLVNYLYNNLMWKSLPVLDMLNQAGYLLVFVLATTLCGVEQLNMPSMIFAALFAMQSHLFGQIMDVDEDTAAGRQSTAISLGVRASKFLLATLMGIEALIALLYFPSPVVGCLMACGSLFFMIDGWRGPLRYSLGFVKLFFVAWNVVVFASIYFVWRYGLLNS